MKPIDHQKETSEWKRQKTNARTAFQKFMAYLSGQNKLITAEDLLGGMLYEYMGSPDGISISRCILAKNANQKYDVQMNINIQPYCNTSGDSTTYAYILHHKNGKPLCDPKSWASEHFKK